MAGLIWDKGGDSVDARVQRFCAGDDVLLDRELLPYDVRATVAHVRGLHRIGLLDEADSRRLEEALERLGEEFSSGAFVLDERWEDGHSAIEAWLTERLGDLGKRVHTGRSRNDQVLVAQRLLLRDALATLGERSRAVAVAFLDRAEADADVPMPGYTHLQQAVPSSVGLWLGGFAEAFLDDAWLAWHVRDWLDACPLGTAAGYGVNLPLDREGVAVELGFSRLQLNPAYAQASRGKLELVALAALGQALLDVRRFAWDVSLFATQELGFVRLPDGWTTGSSIMPNKRNPDPVELLRAAWAVVAGARAEVEAVLSLPSGYHRDLQATKAPLLRALGRGLEALALVPDLVAGLVLCEERLREAIDPESYATDRAVELAAQGVPFRDAYRRVAAELADGPPRTPEESLAARVSPGAPGDLRLDALRARLAELPEG